MSPLLVGREAGPVDGVHGYQRHRLEQALLYQLVAQYYQVFADLMTAQGQLLPEYVQREFEDYLKYDRLEYGFLLGEAKPGREVLRLPRPRAPPDGWS